MFGWFKQYFVPHEGNDYEPHILRLRAVVVMLSVVLFVEIIFLVQALFATTGVSYFSSILPEVIANLTNTERLRANEPALVQDPSLAEAARMKAADMVARGYFAHTSPDGKTPWYWLRQVGYHFRYAGENLAVNFVDSGDIVDAWMASPDHRANILNADFTQIGIGVAKGTYEGRRAIFVVQFLGVPLPPAEVPNDTGSVIAFNPSDAAEQRSAEDATVEGISGEAQTARPQLVTPSFIETVFATPRAMNTFLSVVIGTIVCLGLALTVFVKIKIQRPPLIANAAFVLLVLGSFLVFNQYLSLARAHVF